MFPTPHDPRNFLALAKKLLDLSTNFGVPLQTRVRTAIGRAYYAAFLLSKLKQEARGHKFPDDHTVHICVRNSFSDDQLSHIASKLDQLRDSRSDADYNMNVNLSNIDGDKCLRLAKDILELLETV